MRALALALLAPLLAFGQDQPVDAGPYVPSPQSVVSDMLKLAEVGPEDFVIDLGSGDGRIVRTAALIFGARGFGVEIKDELVRQSNADAEREGIAARVKFIKADLFKTDISQATVLTMYLLPDTVNLLRDKLLGELRPGTRILSHDYPLSGWIPEKYVQMDLEDKVKISGVTTTLIYLYVVPAKVEGRWTASAPGGDLTLNLKQQITRVAGTARTGGKDVTLEDVKLRGERLSFRLAGRTYSARVRGAALEGEIAGGGAWSAKRAR
ncbi:MAG: SAM-dependent methyltransferase [Betaproteobacteria bacterium]|nr:SAM-dependent methyltransferase [Betaproteobacteria bacterium]MDH5211637.1 SAM-dependent methyltransferase [Betaproteobacteria bacterium]